MMADGTMSLWDYVESPYGNSPLPEANRRALVVNPLCGDEVELQLHVSSDGHVIAAHFQGRGCQVSQAAACLLCERIEGLSLAEIETISGRDVLNWCGVQLSPIRQTFALLPWEALRKALAAVPRRDAAAPAEETPRTPVRLVILDRDDTLIRLPEGRRYIAGEDPFELAPGAGEFVATLNGLGVAVAVATNQQGVSLDDYPEITLETVQRLHDRIQDALEPYGGHIDRFYVCPHAAEAQCGCRKPRPGLLKQALWDFSLSASEAAIIGDRETDLQAAAAAGFPTRFLLQSQLDQTPLSHPPGSISVRSFRECREYIVRSLVNPKKAEPVSESAKSSDAAPMLINRFLSWLPADVGDAPVILELGSYTGEQACQFAQVFPKARIFAFEANPDSAPVCRSNTSWFPNITVIEAAVGEQDGEAEFQAVRDGNFGASSLYLASGHNDVQPLEQVPITVRALRLDTWAGQVGVERFDAVWMDLQGAELLALRGMGTLLSTARAVQLEITYRELYHCQVLWPEVRQFLESNGLTLVDEWPDPCGYFGDAVFIRKSPA